MRVCPCWGVEYVLIVQSMSHMPGLPIQTEGFNLHKKAFILKRLVMFFFLFLFTASSNTLPLKLADIFTSVSRKSTSPNFSICSSFTKTPFDCLERYDHPSEGVATRVGGDSVKENHRHIFFYAEI